MKRNYETRCWMCGSTDLEPDQRGMVCRKCGATYNLIPEPGKEAFKGQGWRVSQGLDPYKSDRPFIAQTK